MFCTAGENLEKEKNVKKKLSVILIMMICLLFLSEAYMATISKQEMERVLRLPEIAGRGQN